MDVESTIGASYLTENVIGFAGDRMEPREKVRSLGEVTRVTEDRFTVVLYHNPVVSGYHRAQDAGGVYITDNKLYFGIADGVSIVGGTMNNKSGQMAYELISHLEDLGVDWKRDLYELSEKYKRQNFPGASTLTWGKVQKKNDKWRLKLLVVGDNVNLGEMELLTPAGNLKFENDSHGFVPQDYSPHVQEMVLPETFGLVFSTDGALPTEESFEPLYKSITSKDLKEQQHTIGEFLKTLKDDQTLLLISNKS